MWGVACCYWFAWCLLSWRDGVARLNVAHEVCGDGERQYRYFHVVCVAKCFCHCQNGGAGCYHVVNDENVFVVEFATGGYDKGVFDVWCSFADADFCLAFCVVFASHGEVVYGDACMAADGFGELLALVVASFYFP